MRIVDHLAPGVIAPSLAVGVRQGVPRELEDVVFRSPGARPAHLFFAIPAPDNPVGAHLSLLARISRVCRTPGEIERLMAAVDANAIRRIIDLADQNE